MKIEPMSSEDIEFYQRYYEVNKDRLRISPERDARQRAWLVEQTKKWRERLWKEVILGPQSY